MIDIINTPFLYWDWINIMDHMRISGIEHSSVILNQARYGEKLKYDNYLNKAKRDCLINKWQLNRF